MGLSEQDVRRIVRDEMRRAFSIGSSSTELLPSERAYLKHGIRDLSRIPFGYSSRRELTRAVDNGVLRIGKEVQDRRSPSSKIARYYFDIAACMKRLNTPPEKRAN